MWYSASFKLFVPSTLTSGFSQLTLYHSVVSRQEKDTMPEASKRQAYFTFLKKKHLFDCNLLALPPLPLSSFPEHIDTVSSDLPPPKRQNRCEIFFKYEKNITN